MCKGEDRESLFTLCWSRDELTDQLHLTGCAWTWVKRVREEWEGWGGMGSGGGLPDQRSSLIPQTRSCKCSREVKPQIWHPKPWGEIYLVCELLQQDHKHKNGNDVNMCKHGLGSQTKPKLERFCQVYEMSSLVSELKKACSLWIAQAAVLLHF